MKWSIIIPISLFAILLVFLSSCTITGQATKEINCAALSGTAKDECFFEARQCSKMASADFRDSCVAELAKLKKDLGVCNLVQGDKTRSYCYEQIAELTSNQSICRSIADPYWKNNCHFNLAIQNNRDIYCTFITNNDQRLDCLERIALATNNYELCELLTKESQEKCIQKIAVNLHDVDLCAKLSSGITQDACKLKIAKETNRKSYCESIKTRDIKSICLDYFEK